MSEKVDAKKSPFKDAPTICPLLSMANVSGDQWEDCHKEGCWFYNRALKKCAMVHMAISLAQIAERRGSSLLQRNLDRRMKSLKSQHRP